MLSLKFNIYLCSKMEKNIILIQKRKVEQMYGFFETLFFWNDVQFLNVSENQIEKIYLSICQSKYLLSTSLSLSSNPTTADIPVRNPLERHLIFFMHNLYFHWMQYLFCKFWPEIPKPYLVARALNCPPSWSTYNHSFTKNYNLMRFLITPL